MKRNIIYRGESQAATQMGLLAKLSEGDMISREACYHEHCMIFQN